MEAVGDFSPSVGDATAEISLVSRVSQYEPLEIYGQNVITAEGADWKRHRAVANSAFNEVRTNDSRYSNQLIPFYQANNALVWRETFRVVDEWFSEIDSAVKLKQTATIDLLKDFTKVNPFSVPLTIHLLLPIIRLPCS